VPAGSDWLHEIKYDGYRMMLIRDQDRVRLISRGGYDWVQRFPLIVAAALKLRRKQFVLDDEVVVLGKDDCQPGLLRVGVRRLRRLRGISVQHHAAAG
jgi:bifunctional non-homologous end joining protein LigD